MKNFTLLLILICNLIFSQQAENFNTQLDYSSSDVIKTFAASITHKELKEHLFIIASADFEGRKTGEAGQKKAAAYLVDYYKSLNISSPEGIDYLQKIPVDYFKGRSKNESENVLAFIKGSVKPEEIIIISAHYDHVGMKENDIYFGADDDGSGTVAVLEIAEAFKEAANNGYTPKRSILFLNLTGEEVGLMGAKYYTDFPIFDLKNTVANLNIDMIGRVDKKYSDNPNYVYVIGADKLSNELHTISENANKKHTQLTLDYTYNDESDPNRFYYRSDHYQFAKNNIPIIFYFNGVHDDYHKPTDTPDKINYDLLTKRTQLVFYTAWELANRNERIKLNEVKN